MWCQNMGLSNYGSANMYVKVAGLVYLGAYAGVTQPNIMKTQYKDVP